MNAVDFIVGIFRRDIGRKLTALVLALLLWGWLWWLVIDERRIDLGVRDEKTTLEAEMAAAVAPAVYLVVPSELIVRRVEPARVALTLQGVAGDLRNLAAYAIIELGTEDLEGEDERTVEWILNREMFQFRPIEPDFTSFEVKPQQITVTLARRDTAEIRLNHLNAQVIGQPHASYTFDESKVRVTPNTVTVTGPRAAVEALRADPARLRLEPVDIGASVHDIVQEVGLDRRSVDQDVILRTAGNVVQVTVPIEARSLEVELIYVPVHYDHEESLEEKALRVVQATETLDLKIVGPHAELQGKSTEQLRRLIRPVFDWSGLGTTPLLQASEKVDVLTQGLSLDVAVLDLHSGTEPRIDYVLEAIPREK